MAVFLLLLLFLILLGFSTFMALRFNDSLALSLGILSGGMILGVAGTMYAARHLGKLIMAPVESLRNRIDQVAEDNLHFPPIPQSARELEQLEDSFQQLAERLRIFRDLTDKRFLEVTQTFRTILERFPSPIYFVNQKGEIFYSNPAAGRVPSNGKLPPEIVEWLKDQEEWSEDANVLVDPDEAIPIQMEGTTRYVLINQFPLQLIELSGAKRNQEGQEGAAILLQDVTVTRLSSDLKNNLLETVSHELKTPITSARLALYLLSDNELGPLNKQQAELVASGRQDLDRLLGTIQNLLDLSRIRSRRKPSDMKPVNLNSMVRQTMMKYAKMAETREIKIELDNDRDNRLVKADESRLSVVMNNFLTNAIQHSRAKSTIRVVVGGRNEHYRVEVIDTGKGIPKHLEKRIFDKFSRASEIVDSGGGIGLHMARDIIEEHGGKIGCTSVPDEGCTFYFELPQLKEEI